jgi:hypothetical protein
VHQRVEVLVLDGVSFVRLADHVPGDGADHVFLPLCSTGNRLVGSNTIIAESMAFRHTRNALKDRMSAISPASPLSESPPLRVVVSLCPQVPASPCRSFPVITRRQHPMNVPPIVALEIGAQTSEGVEVFFEVFGHVDDSNHRSCQFQLSAFRIYRPR